MKHQVTAAIIAMTSTLAFAGEMTADMKIVGDGWDVANKQLVQKNGSVVHPISKVQSEEDVYMIKEKPGAPKTAYMVIKQRKITRPVNEYVDAPVFVEKLDPAADWKYIVK